jgi:hypothetical protein
MLFKALPMAAIVTLLAVGFALNAQAGPRLYDGTIIAKGYSNDTTDGTTVPFTLNSPFPIPFGQNCRIGAFVPAYTSNGTLTSTGNITSFRLPSSPHGFNINASEMSQLTSGGSQEEDGTPYIFSKDFADLKNAAGAFGVAQGPGRMGGGLLFTGPKTPPLDGGFGSITVRPGENTFGGAMRLLGTVYSFGGYYSTWLVDTNIAKYTWLIDYHGATGSVSASNVVPAFGSSTAQYIGRVKHLTNITTVYATAMSWTTGTDTVTGDGGAILTVLARKGFDNRDAQGYGDIQMVSPMLTRWVFSGATKGYYTGTVAELHLRIAPEPHEWMLLSAGISVLGLLYRANRRGRRRD